MSQRDSIESRSWWEEETVIPRVRKRDKWMEHVVGRVNKYRPEPLAAVRQPILVLDRHSMENNFTMVEQLHYEPGEAGTGGDDVFMNALAHSMKQKQHRKRNHLAEIKQDLEEALRKREEEEKKQRAEEKERLRRLNHGVVVGEREEDDEELGGMGLVPLELLPANHPSHYFFRGLHPMFGKAEVRGYLPPDTASTFLTRGSGDLGGQFLGNVRQTVPSSAFQDSNELHWQRNVTPMHRDQLGALPTRGTYSARTDMKARRANRSRVLLSETEAGSALFDRGNDNKRQLLSRAGSSTILEHAEYHHDYNPEQQLSSTWSAPRSPSPVTRSIPSTPHRVGIFDPNGNQLIPVQLKNPVTDYLIGASDSSLRERSSRQGIRLGGQRVKDRSLSDLADLSVTSSSKKLDEEKQLESDLKFLNASLGF